MIFFFCKFVYVNEATLHSPLGLTHCGLVMPYGNIGSGNGLVPSGTKPLPESMLTQEYKKYIRYAGKNYHSFFYYIFSCDQAALWMVFSVRLSVCPSVRLSVRLSVCPSVTPFWLCSHHRIIMKFSGVITLDQGKVHAKGQGQRSKVKVTEVTTQIFVSGL